MLQPDAAIHEIRRRFDQNYPDWARKRGTWPLRLGLRPPDTAKRADDPIACHRWADAWRTYRGPGTVEFTKLRFPTGTHSMPKALIVDHPSQAAAVSPETSSTWQRCGQRLIRLQREFPEATFDGIIRRLTDLAEADYQRLQYTVAWLRTHPTSGFLIRQLPIEGIDTKWLLKNRVLVLALLGTSESEPDDASIESMPQSARRRLHERLGLRLPPELIQVAVLDPSIRADVGGMRHFAAAADDLNQWSRHPHTVVILENKETAYAVTGDRPGCVILHGHGFNVASYADITWVHTAHRVIYWGDIDAPGLQFINDLRAYGIQATTILMDTATLESFRHLATDGAGLQRRELPHLTPSEAALHALLTDYAATHDAGLLLEQERIPWPHAERALRAALQEAHPLADEPQGRHQPADR